MTGMFSSLAISFRFRVISETSASREVVDNAFDPQADAMELLEFAEQRIYDIRQGRQMGTILPLSKVLVETYDHLQRISGEDRKDYLGLSTGYKLLDAMITGLNKSDFILIVVGTTWASWAR